LNIESKRVGTDWESWHAEALQNHKGAEHHKLAFGKDVFDEMKLDFQYSAT
jgi:hypothetical protein